VALQTAAAQAEQLTVETAREAMTAAAAVALHTEAGADAWDRCGFDNDRTYDRDMDTDAHDLRGFVGCGANARDTRGADDLGRLHERNFDDARSWDAGRERTGSVDATTGGVPKSTVHWRPSRTGSAQRTNGPCVTSSETRADAISTHVVVVDAA
jgi:hypothetical protein